jgi:hypothetical protein
MDESNGSGTTETSRKLGFGFEHPVLGEVSCLSGAPDLGASWKLSNL